MARFRSLTKGALRADLRRVFAWAREGGPTPEFRIRRYQTPDTLADTKPLSERARETMERARIESMLNLLTDDYEQYWAYQSFDAASAACSLGRKSHPEKQWRTMYMGEQMLFPWIVYINLPKDPDDPLDGFSVLT